MKPRVWISIVVLSASLPLNPLWAQHGPPPGAGPRAGGGVGGAGAAGAGETAAVEKFLSLSDTELDQLLAAIQRIRAMTPEQRVALLEQMQRYRALPDGERAKLRQGWGMVSPEIQDAWRAMMQQATPERRAEIQRELQSLAPAERTARRRELAEAYLAAQDTP
ncbi:DUF3106 domain-containing protein [Actomonas aquatica]|uniref:DUF3106 domain-containing protein n=1 Tax=Actomonas aquatica TaxID=2866162 RepID=A0ABZ1C6C8_9BACT|nr:DUF3106 domain-containing protein [Opitutus sp. WL0086]WRQ86915.1 DUF3106 domain-containing protein [Opitutus sp. WL0086]